MLRCILIMLMALLLSACTVGPRQLGMSQSQWDSLGIAKQQALVEGYRQVHQANRERLTLYKGPNVQVTLNKGKAMMPPFVTPYPIKTTRFVLKPGYCGAVTLKSSDERHATRLPVCYNGLTVMLDPSRYDVREVGGTLRFDYTPIWKRGFTYTRVSSAGYVQLQDVNVSIQTTSDVKPHASDSSL